MGLIGKENGFLTISFPKPLLKERTAKYRNKPVFLGELTFIYLFAHLKQVTLSSLPPNRLDTLLSGVYLPYLHFNHMALGVYKKKQPRQNIQIAI